MNPHCACSLHADRLFKALIELEGAGMLPSSQEEAAGLADTIRRRGPQDTVTAVLPHVRIARRFSCWYYIVHVAVFLVIFAADVAPLRRFGVVFVASLIRVARIKMSHFSPWFGRAATAASAAFD